jgi:hypothetical protein
MFKNTLSALMRGLGASLFIAAGILWLGAAVFIVYKYFIFSLILVGISVLSICLFLGSFLIETDK